MKKHNGYRRRRGYEQKIDIGIRMKHTMSDETLEFIKRVDIELYNAIMED